jgi:hypothetical protein
MGDTVFTRALPQKFEILNFASHRTGTKRVSRSLVITRWWGSTRTPVLWRSMVAVTSEKCHQENLWIRLMAAQPNEGFSRLPLQGMLKLCLVHCGASFDATLACLISQLQHCAATRP